jgi:3-deoxy-manno-octulosonate cytidylyltransferase (CMP-KDO synthetase)
MMEKDVLILIPARYASTRFPGKPLAKIAGKSMVQHVVENCQKAGFDCAVVTDSEEIETHVKEFGDVCRVDDDVSSGSERMALAYERFYKDRGYKYIINVQGDEPLIEGRLLEDLAKFHKSSRYDITTVIKQIPIGDESEASFTDPNRVKAIWMESSGQCHYFSRSPIPYDREGTLTKWNLHIGVYSYRVDALFKYLGLEHTHLDQIEQLEQLRALGHGMTIGAIETSHHLVGVDCKEDIEKVEGVLRG